MSLAMPEPDKTTLSRRGGIATVPRTAAPRRPLAHAGCVVRTPIETHLRCGSAGTIPVFRTVGLLDRATGGPPPAATHDHQQDGTSHA